MRRYVLYSQIPTGGACQAMACGAGLGKHWVWSGGSGEEETLDKSLYSGFPRKEEAKQGKQL